MHEVDDTNTSHIAPQDRAQTSKQSHNVPAWEKAAPIWIAGLGALGFGVLYMALPENLTFGPSWVPLAIEIVILLPIVLSRLLRHPISHHTTRLLMFLLLGIITIALIIGVVLLIATLPHREESQAAGLLRTGVLLWLSNILVFALWYWEIDGGGPRERHIKGYKSADFLFPQQVDGNTEGWVPNFIDYLFLSFTGATALSPTDTYPLSRPAKGLMMVEAIIALVVLAILIGRAVNIL